MGPHTQREDDIRRGIVRDAGSPPPEHGAVEDQPTEPPTGMVGDAPRQPRRTRRETGQSTVGTPTGMGDPDGIGGTTGAVAHHEGDLPGELGPNAGRSSKVR